MFQTTNQAMFNIPLAFHYTGEQGFLYWITISPNILGSTIPCNDQPTLNTAHMKQETTRHHFPRFTQSYVGSRSTNMSLRSKYHGYIQINHSKNEPNHKWPGSCIILKYDFLGLPHHSLSSFRHCTCCSSCMSFFSSDRRLCGSLVHQCWMLVVPGRIVGSFPGYCR